MLDDEGDSCSCPRSYSVYYDSRVAALIVKGLDRFTDALRGQQVTRPQWDVVERFDGRSLDIDRGDAGAVVLLSRHKGNRQQEHQQASVD